MFQANRIKLWANDGSGVFVELTEHDLVEAMENNRKVHDQLMVPAISTLTQETETVVYQ